MNVMPEAMLYKMLLDTKGAPPFPPHSDRAAWEEAARHLLAPWIMAGAEEALGKPVPFLPATLFLDYDRTGRRTPYQTPMGERRSRLAYLVLAEGIDNKGRFLDDITDLIWAICEESTWVLPAHQRNNNEVLPDVENLWIDLAVAGTAMNLVEADHLLGDSLPAAVRRRVRQECRRRVTEVFLRRSDFWWLGGMRRTNNWNAVCNAGAVAVALYLEADVHVQARVLAKVIASLPAYLESFDQDGCTSEGAGYWGYGFGHYAILAHLVETRTEGRVDLLSGEHFTRICKFPVQLEMSPGRFVNFSDAAESTVMPAGICCWLAQRCGAPELGALGRRHLELIARQKRTRLEYLLRDLFWTDGRPATQEGLLNTAFFRGYQWLVSRHDLKDPNTLVLAAKGGHNAEDHNQNDVGQFIVHVNGESVILDLGAQVYTKGFFGPDRYSFLECRSFGHCVPVVNGMEQRQGRDYQARLLATEFGPDADMMELELSGAYPAEAGAESVLRRLTLARTQPRGEIAVTDTFRFRDGAGEFESRLHTLAAIDQVRPGYLRLTGQKATLGLHYDPGAVSLQTEELTPDENQQWGPVLRRLRFTQRGREGRIALRIVPE